ncbi:MAG TPA: TIGR03435 family protein [Bryobacteraceae bacterium]|nr:TIGR03435 family protein [Bryobacteraceae bacterium]
MPAALFAQQGFEAAAIHAVAPGEQCEQSLIGPMPGGGFRVECLPLKSIVTWAYQIQNYQLDGGPSWVESERWNIRAVAPGKPDPSIPTEYEKMSEAQRKDTMETLRARVRTLLADRFQLVLRQESREQTIYALTIARNGPKMKESEDQSKSGFMMGGRRGTIESRGSGLDLLVQYLGIQLGRPVTDRTGLRKHYDFKLTWTPDSPNNPTPPDGPTVFTAIQEQLGLKLESAKAPVDTLVIEHAEKPEN